MKKLPLIIHALKISLSDRKHFKHKKKRVALPNLHKVNHKLYRSGQPTKKGLKQLEEMNIKTVVNLRGFHCDRRKIKRSRSDLRYKRIPIHTWNVKDKHIIEFIKLIEKEKDFPLLVHCHHGADRTGLMIAIYRIFYEGWNKERAIEELVHGGYGFHRQWKNIIEYIKNMDVDKIKKEAGLN